MTTAPDIPCRADGIHYYQLAPSWFHFFGRKWRVFWSRNGRVWKERTGNCDAGSIPCDDDVSAELHRRWLSSFH